MSGSRILLALLLFGGGCIKKTAVNAIADQLSGEGGGAFTQDDDLEFVGDAIPFALKLMESIRDAAPDHDGIRESLCSGYTQYAMVFVAWPAEKVRYDDFGTTEAGQQRATKFLGRARKNCLDALEIRHPGTTASLLSDTDSVLASTTIEDVSLLYWTGAPWLAAISMSKEDMEIIGQLPTAAAIIHHAYSLDPDWDRGSLHDLLIALEPSLPLPGGMDRAREHFDRAVALSKGTRASPYVSLATSVSVVQQNRGEFVSLMEQALAIDPAASPPDELANLYAQERARFYLAHLDDLFAE